MNLYRNTYAEIDLKNLETNIREIIKKINNYKYYFGVIKADSYGHGDTSTVQSMINGGCNYLAVATLGEALELRKAEKEIPILCLGVVPKEFIKECIENNITITISSLKYLEEIKNLVDNNIKLHIKINTGMNRLRYLKYRRIKRSIKYSSR